MQDNFISIRHDIPGRLRVRMPDKGRGVSERLQKLQALNGVLVVRFNAKCASLVVRYDPLQLSRERLLRTIRNGAPARKESSHAQQACSLEQAGTCSCSQQPSTGKALRRFLGISGLVGIVFTRTTLMGAVVAQTLFSPLGIAVVAFSLPMARKGLQDLRRGRPSLDSFLSGGVLASVVGGQAMTALEILWINSGAELLSAWISERSRKHISEILEITSHHTFVLVDGVEVERDVASLSEGDVVVLHMGEKISVDGVIVHGQALVNEAPLTGRQEHVHKTVDDDVYAGTFVQEGIVHVKASHVGDETYLARVMHKVQAALESRAPIEGVADRLASRLVKIGFAATSMTWLLTGSIWRAYTVLLVMACPCATVLAASTAVSAAMNAAARNQILIKGGRYLEEVGKARTVFFDKTGTLTTSQPSLASVVTVEGVDEAQLLQLAVSAERHNHHPLAQAILAEAARRDIAALPHEECYYHMGMGVRAVLSDKELLVGNAKLTLHYEVDISALAVQAMALQEQGLTVLYVVNNKNLLGLLGFEPEVRPECLTVINRLRRLGVERVVLITGDEDATARELFWRLGLDAYHASAMPEEKAAIVAEAVEHHGPVLMVGDGINDALALTRADVGVAFGVGGSEVAVEAADIALVKDDLHSLVSVYSLSRKTIRVVHENFWLATGSNILGMVLGAVGLLTPVTAGLVHIGHSLGVLANSSRLLRLPEFASNHSGNGAADGLQHAGQAAQVSGHQTSPARTDQGQVQPGYRQ